MFVTALTHCLPSAEQVSVGLPAKTDWVGVEMQRGRRNLGGGMMWMRTSRMNVSVCVRFCLQAVYGRRDWRPPYIRRRGRYCGRRDRVVDIHFRDHSRRNTGNTLLKVPFV